MNIPQVTKSYKCDDWRVSNGLWKTAKQSLVCGNYILFDQIPSTAYFQFKKGKFYGIEFRVDKEYTVPV